jgi:DNA-directed RNA polymerase subunit RPC12/RpoP
MAYFPNSTAGMIFDEQCCNCPFGDEPCEIALMQMVFNYDQLKDGNDDLRRSLTLLVDDDGICQFRLRMQKHGFVGPDGQISFTECEPRRQWRCRSCKKRFQPPMVGDIYTCPACGTKYSWTEQKTVPAENGGGI